MTYGCFNRAPYKPETVRYGLDAQTGKVVKTVIPFRMSMDCQYQKNDQYSDPGCVGCCHKATEDPVLDWVI